MPNTSSHKNNSPSPLDDERTVYTNGLPRDRERLFTVSPDDSAKMLVRKIATATRYLGADHPRVVEIRREYRAARLIELIEKQTADGWVSITPAGAARVLAAVEAITGPAEVEAND